MPFIARSLVIPRVAGGRVTVIKLEKRLVLMRDCDGRRVLLTSKTEFMRALAVLSSRVELKLKKVLWPDFASAHDVRQIEHPHYNTTPFCRRTTAGGVCIDLPTERVTLQAEAGHIVSNVIFSLEDVKRALAAARCFRCAWPLAGASFDVHAEQMAKW